jgi:hypothetical protein
VYRFARYSQDENRSHFQKCPASREGGQPACQVVIRQSIEVRSVEPIGFALA